MTPEERVARVTRIEHPIIGTDNPLQGTTQAIPEALVLCLSCGWMPCGEYGDHLAAEVVKALGLREERRESGCAYRSCRGARCVHVGGVRLVTDWREVES
ncbi:hypothetical protein K8Z61_18450 [Nocardioides sp. TRM66260-LWL]|uniref:hypothetical protein n=1 Tax=Nocardioides sp. TRM66260-LWL TaxID=2874478 RepID=UPI001CC6FE18|nr:hypothetical protein [Nocardioides sp. TRM66260-LWL]MBZ5736476.1 hypothetical protein [Nocardioides sp. TRM66260-LWL]